MQVKTCPATVKAMPVGDGADEGVFEAFVATYDVDSVRDQIIPGAFKDSLEAWERSGAPIPVIWSHKADDPECHIGYVEAAEERAEGLWVRGRLDMDEPKGRKVHKLLKGGRVRNMSFAYDIDDARPSEKAAGVQELHRLTLHEVGPCLIGANRATSVLAVKHDQPVTVNVHTGTSGDIQTSDETPAADQATDDLAGKTAQITADLKAGRVLSRRNHQALTEALETIQRVLASSEVDDGPDSGSEKATPTEPADTPVSQVAVEAAPDTKSVVPAGGAADPRLPTRLDLWLLELEADTY